MTDCENYNKFQEIIDKLKQTQKEHYKLIEDLENQIKIAQHQINKNTRYRDSIITRNICP